MILLEAIATSPEDCAAIEQGGGNRIELTSALGLGGLTPSLGLLIEARSTTRLPIMVMIRPCAGGFCYTRGEFAVMQRDVDLALANGANGIVFGILTADGAVDGPRIRQLVDQAKGKVTVFHRAIDVTPDPLRTLDMLIELGVTRVLTSGQAPNASKARTASPPLSSTRKGRSRSCRARAFPCRMWRRSSSARVSTKSMHR